MPKSLAQNAAVDRKRPKAYESVPSGLPPMPRRPTPSIATSVPPEKRQKGDPKGAAERVPSGSKGAQKGAAIRAASAHSSGKGKGQAKGVEKGKIDLDNLPRAPIALVPNRNALVDRLGGVAIRRNPNVDYRIAERPVRVDPVPSRHDAPRNFLYNAQYRGWMNEAWVDQHPDPQAGNRDQERNDGAWDDYHPSDNVRGRGETWPRPRHPSNLQGRARSRTPLFEKGKGKGYRVETRVYTHDDSGQSWEIVDREYDEHWGRQNIVSRYRRNLGCERAD